MTQKGHWIQRIVNATQICGEALPHVPIIELAGDKRVLIEHHDGVVEYDTERITILVKYGTVCIQGGDLRLKQMTKEQLVATGRIDSVQIQRR